MAVLSNFKGCKVFIRPEKGDAILADTTITAYDAERLIITLNVNTSDIQENEKVFALILQKESVLEFRGTVKRKDNTGRCEIGLFKGREKEDREATRYVVNIPAKIVSVMIGRQVFKFDAPTDATVINLSTTGILMRIPPNMLNVGTKFQIKLEIGGSESVLNGNIKRIQETADDYIDYGCELIGRE